MEPVSPVLPMSKNVEVTVGANQKEYLPLPAFHTQITTVTRWRLTDAERAHIAAGGDLFISVMDFRMPLQPILPLAIPEDDVLAIVIACEETVLRGNP
jgi:hypothetical protein